MDFSLSLSELSKAVNLHQSQAVASSVPSLAFRNFLGVQDEAAIKKQKRMEANRMSAKRSRLRKQAESDELKHMVETFANENQNLKNEFAWLLEACKKLNSENCSLLKRQQLAMTSQSPQAPNIMPKAGNDKAPFGVFPGGGNH